MSGPPIAELRSLQSREPPGVVAYRHVRPESAIDEYARHLVGALRTLGAPAAYASDGLASASRAAIPPPWIILQYNPLSYGRWSIAPGLLQDALRLRHRWPGTTFAVMVHEAWLARRDTRSALMGTYQRLQLRALLRLADRTVVSREALVREIGGDALHIPVASNITPVVATPAAARAALGLEDRLVVALFGTAGSDRAYAHAVAAVEALAAGPDASRLCVLNLGRGAPSLALAPDIDVRTPGRLMADALSLRLRACDLLLLPFTDGLSTRRTTLMAGLAHGLPVVGLHGVNTDRVLLDHPDALRMTPVGDRAAFATAAVALATDRGERAAAGVAGQRLYRARFDWPVLARRMLAAVRS